VTLDPTAPWPATRTAAGSPGGGDSPQLDLGALCQVLRQAAGTLDRWWHESADLGSTGFPVQLAEASHCIHRALIALEAHRPD
jgi:hypothetical protein